MSHRKTDLGIPCPRKICQSSARTKTQTPSSAGPSGPSKKPIVAPSTDGGTEPGLSRRRIEELAAWYRDETHQRYNENTLDTPALDAELRAILRKEVAFPEHVEVEFERVMKAVFGAV
jgi:hypothetical protein